jgi:hypothetical protein
MKTTRVIEFRAYIGDKMEYGVHTAGQFGFAKKNWKVMQYTGRDDAKINGTEVWEANIIVKLGCAINDQYAMNITEPLVIELVYHLDPEHEIFKNEHYLKYVNGSNGG